MAVLSTLLKIAQTSNITHSNITKTLLSAKQNVLKQAIRKMSSDEDRTFHVTPSRFQYTKFKDDLHFFTALGVVPLGLLILFVNIFIGPATLSEIPEGYEPRHWEYYKHPITRFISKHFHDDPQVIHERNLHALQEEKEKHEWSDTIRKAKRIMNERQDYKTWSYIPSDQGRQVRMARKIQDDIEELRGYR